MAALTKKGMAKNLKNFTMPTLNREQGIRSMSGTVPKMKAYAPVEVEGETNKGKANKVGSFVPLYVALGMIALSLGLGFHTAKQQFMHAPGVRVQKSHREMVSEVEEPERVARESKDFINKSFFRKVAHVQELRKP